MICGQKLIRGAAAFLIAFAMLTAGDLGSSQAGPPEFDEFPALRNAPDVPLGSVILRRTFPDHPVAAPIADEFPGEAGFPEAGSPIGRSPIVNGRAVSGDSTCDKSVDLTGQIGGVVSIAALDTGFCTNADIDSYVGNDGGTYVVQAGGQERIFTLTEVTDPAAPAVLSQLYFIRRAKGTYTPDVKAFRQGTRDYIVVGLERTKVTQPCGVLFFDVTAPDNPVMGAQFIGSGWCDVHNVFVETDASGDGIFVYVTADNTNDLRVLDILDVDNPTEVGSYAAPGANTSNYVHDVTVVDHGGSVGRRVYLSYWESGLIILDAATLTPLFQIDPKIDPDDVFLTHHAVPSADGNLVFIQDEFLGAPGEPQTGEPVQMWALDSLATCSNVGDSPPCYIDGLALGSDVAINPAHNLEIRYDIDATRLYVGWYKLGLQAWDFSPAGFDRVTGNPSSAIYHQVQTELDDGEYSGTWGVRLEQITVGGVENTYIFQSDRNYGLIVDRADSAGGGSGSGVGPISDTDDGADKIAENMLAGTSVGITASAVDPDEGDTVSYRFANGQQTTTDGRFAIDSTSGVIVSAKVLDAETATIHVVAVEAVSSDTSQSSKSFAIEVVDVDEFDVGPINDVDGNPDQVAENASVGTPVGITAFAEDLDVSDNVTYRLPPSAGGLFAIDANSGVITVAAALDSDTVTEYTVTVEAVSSDTSIKQQDFTITETAAPALTLQDLGSTNEGKFWFATVGVTVAGAGSVDIIATWSWNGGTAVGSCQTTSDSCSVASPDLRKNKGSVTYTVDSVGGTPPNPPAQITLFKP